MSSYLPGYGPATTRMLTGRTAAERAAFVPAAVLAGARVLDVGCGPGTVTAGLAARARLVVGIDVAAEARASVRGSALELPVADGAVDVVFAHALVEHLAAPPAFLAEARRVLRPGGTLAVASSDWSGARITPPSPAARQAVDGYRAARRAAGADPDAGARLADWGTGSGFTVVTSGAAHRVDMAGADLAAYVGARTSGAVSAAAVAWAAEDPPATVTQRWVEVLARRP